MTPSLSIPPLIFSRPFLLPPWHDDFLNLYETNRARNDKVDGALRDHHRDRRTSNETADGSRTCVCIKARFAEYCDVCEILCVFERYQVELERFRFSRSNSLPFFRAHVHDWTFVYILPSGTWGFFAEEYGKLILYLLPSFLPHLAPTLH